MANLHSLTDPKEFTAIEYAVDNRVAYITLNRPDRLNAVCMDV